MSYINSSKKIHNPPIAILGAGSFGSTIANLVAPQRKVFLYMRNANLLAEAKSGFLHGRPLHPNITPTDSLQTVCEQCYLIFPIISSKGMRDLMQQASPFLRPDHILIHGIKGVSVQLQNGEPFRDGMPISRENLRTMSDIIYEETVVRRVGSISGPNLAKEIAAGQPAATVIGSRYKEVIECGRDVLRSDLFRVYGNSDIFGVELAGVLKNILAIASGIVGGLGYGENTKAMLITRGLRELLLIGNALEANSASFLGLSGIGDIIATCAGNLSRNYQVGYRLSQGETLEQISKTMTEVAEGVNTIQVAKGLSRYYRLNTPIINELFEVLFREKDIGTALKYLMDYDLDKDVDFSIAHR